MRWKFLLPGILLLTPVILAEPANPDDGTILTMDKGGGEVQLLWSGDAPPYEIRRSFSAETIRVDADGMLGETNDSRWGEIPPPNRIVYYVVNPTGRCFVAGADAYVDNTLPDSNFGSGLYVQVDRQTIEGSAVERSTYLRFNLDAIPQGSTIHSATLEMLADNTGITPTWDGVIRQIEEPWSESSLTWNRRPVFDLTVDERLTFESGPGWSRWDISAMTRDWVSGTQPNHGVVVQNGTLHAVVQFHSHEGSVAGGGFHKAPRLCVDWTTPQDAGIEQIHAESWVEPTFDSESSRMEFLSGDIPVNVASTDAVVLALGHLYEYRDLYQLRDPQAQLYLERVRAGETADDMDFNLFFGQRAFNIPVFGAYAEVHVDMNQIQVAGGNFLPEVPAPKEPRILQEEAKLLAQDAVTGIADGTFGTPKLSYFNFDLLTWQPGQPKYQPGSPVYLTWKVGVTGVTDGGEPTSWVVMIDAIDGTPRFIHEQGESACSKPKNENIDIQTVNYTTSGTCWNFQTSDDRWFNENGPTGRYPGASGDAFLDGQNAFDYSFDVYDFYYRNFCRRSWNGKNGQMENLVHWGTTNNAQFSRGCGHMVFSDGHVTRDIFGHEFRHGVDNKEAKLKYVDQSGALDESLADFFGSMLGFEYEAGNWFIGDSRGTGSSTRCTNATGRSWRNMSDPPDCSSNVNGTGTPHPDHKSLLVPPPPGKTRNTANDKGWVHINSGIPNKAAFLITDGGTHNGLVINGIGRPKAWDLLHWTHVNRLGKTSGFATMRRQTIDLARHWAILGTHGFTMAEVCSVINAWSSVGYSDPDTNCDGFADNLFDGDNDGRGASNDNCVNVKNWDQSDIDNDGLGDVCDDDIDGDGVLNRSDNCPEDANPNQADSNGDGVGDPCADEDADKIRTTEDNCPDTPNGMCGYTAGEVCDINGDGVTSTEEYRLGLQRDEDGDGEGDACDDDIDGDGILNGPDLCDYTFGGTADSDEDGVGNVCDNCAFVFNPDQADLDGDGEGDICDSDRDGDGHPNEVDNCPDDHNPSQGDNDGNGLGFACDLGEWVHFDGMRNMVELDMFMQFNDLLKPVRFEIFPCTDNCPDWIGPDFRTDVIIQLDRELTVRIVDDEGEVLDSSRFAGNHDLSFRVEADYSYTSPALNLVPYDNLEARDRVQMRRFFLEFWLPTGQNPNNVQGTVEVDSFER